MKKGLQLLILFCALLLPGLFFLFLKWFGKNEYVVPPRYQHGEIVMPDQCGPAPSIPYLVPDSIRTLLDGSQLAVIYFDSQNEGLTHETEVQFQRVAESFDNHEVALLSMKRDQPHRQSLRCVLLMRSLDSAVVLDRAGQIRGYYGLASTAETDRLLDELAIILKKY